MEYSTIADGWWFSRLFFFIVVIVGVTRGVATVANTKLCKWKWKIWIWCHRSDGRMAAAKGWKLALVFVSFGIFFPSSLFFSFHFSLPQAKSPYGAINVCWRGEQAIGWRDSLIHCTRSHDMMRVSMCLPFVENINEIHVNFSSVYWKSIQFYSSLASRGD